jgi:hypothetical protein
VEATAARCSQAREEMLWDMDKPLASG